MTPLQRELMQARKRCTVPLFWSDTTTATKWLQVREYAKA